VKWALGLVVVLAVGCVAAFAVAVGTTRDAIPVDLRACVRASDAIQVRSPGDLGSRVRTDVGAGALREVSRRPIGPDTAILLQGTGYRMLVLAAKGSPPLDGALPRRAYLQAAQFALVARETDPVRGELEGCVTRVAADR
jgi:hypothetical protein